MRRLLMVITTACLLFGAAVISVQSQDKPTASADLQIASEARNPWTHLRLNRDPGDVRFAIVSDRTGGHRANVFAQAVDKINLLQPEFVLSVGDLIEGQRDESQRDRIEQEWREFQGYVNRLQMPFFYVPGNHDISNQFMGKLWREKFGRAYYHFVYRKTLFLVLNSNDPLPGRISADQIAYVKKTLEDNRDVQWTIVAFHQPLWTENDGAKNGWREVEQLLNGRSYTVFVGHLHRYQKYVRNGMNYYQLATTGGASKMRGLRYQEFDHVVLVTVKKDGPVLANILLDSIYPEDLRAGAAIEPGHAMSGLKRTQPIRGKVFLDGAPLPEAQVVFHLADETAKQKFSRIADARTEADGSFVLTSYTANDGAPAGDYRVTIHGTGDRKVPDRYQKVGTTELQATVKIGANEFTLELKK